MTMTAPTLILIGEADEASPVERCREMVAHAQPDGAPIALTVYPGVHVTQLTPGVRYLGNWLEYNEPAAKDAEAKTRAFLAAHLSRRADRKVRKARCGPNVSWTRRRSNRSVPTDAIASSRGMNCRALPWRAPNRSGRVAKHR
jgi:hypothetical protein